MSLLARFALTALLAPLSLHAAAAPTPIDVRDLVQFERVGSPALSPDGTQVAYTVRTYDLDAAKGVTRIWLRDIDGSDSRAVSSSLSSAGGPTWGPKGDRLYFLSGRSGSQQVWMLPLGGGEAEQLTHSELSIDDFRLSPDGTILAYTQRVFPDCTPPVDRCTADRVSAKDAAHETGVLYDQLFVRHWDTWGDGRQAQLFTLALGKTDAQPAWLTHGLDADVPSTPFGDLSEMSFSPDGRTIVFSARLAGSDEPWSTNFDLYSVPSDASAAPKNLTEDNPAWDTAPRITPDGRTLIYLAMKRAGFEADRFAIMSRPLAGGPAREVDPDWDRSPSSIELSPDGRSLLVTADHLGEHPLFSVRLSDGKVDRLTQAGYVSAISAGKRDVVIARDDLAHPTELYRMPLRGGEPKRITDHSISRLEGLALGEYRQFEFAGANGETVMGWIIEPAGRQEGQRYPLAFLIHGGPQGSMGNHWHYRWNPQLFAGMGYASVMIDFHGSTGYGQAFTDSISGDWGGKPLEDLKKGLSAALQKEPWIDGDRSCALGASYGGYMINWIAGQWPDGFDCLVNHDGVFDARSMYYGTEELWFPEWEHGGPYYKNPAGYEGDNPVQFVDRWKTPMLVIHGAQDFRVPLEQGLGAFTALQRQGVPSKFLLFPDENHWVLNPANSVQWYDTVGDWLDRWTATKSD